MAELLKPDERQYHKTTSPYILPNDGTEQNRLEQQAQALETLMLNEVFHGLPKTPKRILDIGVGTGRSTIQLAQTFPNAQTIGVDLSPVPAIHKQPSNAEFVQGDIRQLSKSGDKRFTTRSFDYVFSRVLSLGMPDWEGYFQDVHSMLAREGRFEVQEFEIGHHDADGVEISETIPAVQVFYDLTAAKGLDRLIAVKAKSLMEKCGFVNVQEKKFRVPFVEDPDIPEAMAIQKVASKYAVALRPMWYRLGEGLYSKEELDRMSQAMIDVYEGFGPGTHTYYYVVTGQKPA